MAILMAAFFAYQNLKLKEEVKVAVEEPTPIVEGLIVPRSYETKVLNYNDPYVKFDIKYPYFTKADSTFNLKIETLIKDQMEEHKKLSKENWQARYDTQVKGDNIPLVPKDEDKFSFFSDFTIVQSNSTYISFVSKYGGFSGGAHGYENNVSFNYNVKTQKVIELNDLFKDNPTYLNSLSRESRVYLKKEFIIVTEEDKKNSTPEALKEYVDNMTSQIEAGTKPKIENFNVFTFTSDKVKIYFAQYQVGPYVIGSPEFVLDRK